MSASRVLGYAAKAVGQPLEPFEYAPPDLGENDVRVSVTHCGVCHTDIHAIDNYYGITDFPFVPGHEIVGYVSAVGPAVSGLTGGDRVGIGWHGRSCMQCEWCLKGEEQLCMDIVPSGTWVPYGGFSSSVVVDSRFAYPLPPAMPSQVARSAYVCRHNCLLPTPRLHRGPHTGGRHCRSGGAGPSSHPIRARPWV